MVFQPQHRLLLRRSMAVIAIIFGLLTIFAGSRILFGGVNPGYLVFKPLLIFNTVMGVAYVLAGVALWRDLPSSLRTVGMVLAINLVALGIIGVLYASGDNVAPDSLRAMTLRCTVWFVLLMGTRMTRFTQGDTT